MNCTVFDRLIRWQNSWSSCHVRYREIPSQRWGRYGPPPGAGAARLVRLSSFGHRVLWGGWFPATPAMGARLPAVGGAWRATELSRGLKGAVGRSDALAGSVGSGR